MNTAKIKSYAPLCPKRIYPGGDRAGQPVRHFRRSACGIRRDQGGCGPHRRPGLLEKRGGTAGKAGEARPAGRFRRGHGSLRLYLVQPVRGAPVHGTPRLSGSWVPGARQPERVRHPRNPGKRRRCGPGGAGPAQGDPIAADGGPGQRLVPAADRGPVQRNALHDAIAGSTTTSATTPT